MNTTGRDYKREAATESPKRRRERAERNRARRAMMKQLTEKHGKAVAERMMHGKDVDHKKPLGIGGSNKPSNWRLRSEHSNRADKKGLGGRTTRPKNPLKD
jgi:hypothetical protein